MFFFFRLESWREAEGRQKSSITRAAHVPAVEYNLHRGWCSQATEWDAQRQVIN